MQVCVWHMSISTNMQIYIYRLSKSSFYINSENMLPEWINYNILQWHSNSTSSLGCTRKLCRAGSQASHPCPSWSDLQIEHIHMHSLCRWRYKHVPWLRKTASWCILDILFIQCANSICVLFSSYYCSMIAVMFWLTVIMHHVIIFKKLMVPNHCFIMFAL